MKDITFFNLPDLSKNLLQAELQLCFWILQFLQKFLKTHFHSNIMCDWV